MDKNNHHFTYEEVAVILGVSRGTVYNWQNEGLIPNGRYTSEKLNEAVRNVIEKKQHETSQEVENIRRRLTQFQEIAVTSSPA